MSRGELVFKGAGCALFLGVVALFLAVCRAWVLS